MDHFLGRNRDAIFAAFYQRGEVKVCYSDFRTNDFASDQKKLTINLSRINNLDPGSYRLILVINNQLALRSPEVLI